MVSDSELVHRLWVVLRNADLSTTTATSVRCTLEEVFGVDLSDRKAFFRNEIDLFLQGQTCTAGEYYKTEVEIDEEGAEGPVNVKPEDDCNSVSEEVESEEESDGKRSDKSRSEKLINAVKKRSGRFSKLYGLSPQLQKLLGESKLARPEVMKKIWDYIREKDLQDPKDRRNILCDESLRSLFGVNSVHFFQLTKVLSQHIWPLDEEDGSNERKVKRQKGKGSNERKVKRQKGKGSGFLGPLPLSDALVKFFGTGENELSRADAVKRIWDYIKQNNLQDPIDKRRIICDEKLKLLLEIDSFDGFTVSKLLAAHFVEAE